MTEIEEPVDAEPPPSAHKEPEGGGKKDRHPCADGNHDWECNAASCADCWDPPCEPNRKKEQDAYEARNLGATPEERMANYKTQISTDIAAGKDAKGLGFEEKVLDNVSAEAIVHYRYLAHCRTCHVQAEIDVVTKTSVIECKASPKGFDLEQMKTRIIPIAKKCFPGKRIVCASSDGKKLAAKLAQWTKHLGGESLQVLEV